MLSSAPRDELPTRPCPAGSFAPSHYSHSHSHSLPSAPHFLLRAFFARLFCCPRSLQLPLCTLTVDCIAYLGTRPSPSPYQSFSVPAVFVGLIHALPLTYLPTYLPTHTPNPPTGAQAEAHIITTTHRRHPESRPLPFSTHQTTTLLHSSSAVSGVSPPQA